MKVAISSTDNHLDATIDPRFGRCRYFIIVETNDMSYEALENANAELSTSAGIQAASFVASKGVEAVITGNCGPKATQVFASTDIQVLTGQSGVVKAVVEQFKKGELVSSPTKQSTETLKSAQTATTPGVRQPGMGSGGGRGMGGGGGMGMGGGRGMGGGGRGMGRRCQNASTTGNATVARPVQQTAGNLPKDQTLQQLKQQAAELKKQMEEIESKIKQLK